MLINVFSEHIAYTFDENENLFPLGTRVLGKMNLDSILLSETVTYNGKIRLLYNLSEKTSLNEIINVLPESEVISLLMDFLKIVHILNENDFVRIETIEVDFNRLYYDTKLKHLNCIVLPVNSICDFRDGISWQERYRNTLVTFCSYIFSGDVNRYNEVYHKIMDFGLPDMAIADFLYSYDFGIRKLCEDNLEYAMEYALVSNGIREKIMTLQHSSMLGNILFRISQSEFILGKSQKLANGIINISTAISRKHCIIRKTQEGFTVEDLDSANGTRINGYSIGAGQQYFLCNGDSLQLADLIFTVRVE